MYLQYQFASGAHQMDQYASAAYNAYFGIFIAHYKPDDFTNQFHLGRGKKIMFP